MSDKFDYSKDFGNYTTEEIRTHGDSILNELHLKPIMNDTNNILFDSEKKVFVFIKDSDTTDIIRSNPDIMKFDLIDFAVIHIDYAYRNNADVMQYYFDMGLEIFTNNKNEESVIINLVDKPIPLHLTKELDIAGSPTAVQLKEYVSLAPEYADEVNYYRQLCEKAQAIKKRMTEIMGIPFDYRFDSIDGQTDFMI